MDIDQIEYLVNEVYVGNKIDGRKLRALKNRGFIDADGVVSFQGKVLCGIFENKPHVQNCDIQFDDEIVEVTEYSVCSCGGETVAFSENMSAAKMVDEYNQYVTFCNNVIDEHWDMTMDSEPKKWSRYIIRKATDDYWSDRRYTFDIVKDIVKDIMGGKTCGDITTSKKYSFSDTPDEADFYKTESDGKVVFSASIIFY